MTPTETTALIRLLVGAYGNKFQINEHTPAAWATVLKDVAFADAQKAMQAHWIADKSGFPPSAPELLRLALSLASEKQEELTVAEGFELVRQSIRRGLSRRAATNFIYKKSPKTYHVTKGGGFYDRLLHATDSDRNFVYRDFVSAWNDWTERDETRSQAKALAITNNEALQGLLHIAQGGDIKAKQ